MEDKWKEKLKEMLEVMRESVELDKEFNVAIAFLDFSDFIEGLLKEKEEEHKEEVANGIDWLLKRLDKRYHEALFEGDYDISNDIAGSYAIVKLLIKLLKLEMQFNIEVKQPIKETKGLRPLNPVIQVCPICGLVDAYKGDNHSCEQHIQQQELED